MRGTVFLDRDGTLNVKAPDDDYVKHPDELRMLPGAAEAVAAFNRAGLRVILVTNQRGVSRGLTTLDDVGAVHRALAEHLAAVGAHLDGIYVCPHGHGECDCRKPGPGLLRQAREADPEIDFGRSLIVGDSSSDVETGRALGMATVGLGPSAGGDHNAPDLASAAPWILDYALSRWR